MAHIPINLLKERTQIGLEVKRISDPKSWSTINALGIHRDDNFMFILVEHAKGQGSMELDFKPVFLSERSLCCVTPGQVHYTVKAGTSVAWLISIAPSLMPKDYFQIFDNNFLQQQVCTLTESQFTQCLDILRIFENQYRSNPDAVFYKQLTYAILNLFLCAAASIYLSASTLLDNNASRPVQITQGFKKLLQKNIQSQKGPSFYANHLNISETYLNEAIKKTTGFTATYWIQQEVMLEAKRLLCFNKLTVKEIAHALGYDDHTYFSKLFKKSELVTPLAFRSSYLK